MQESLTKFYSCLEENKKVAKTITGLPEGNMNQVLPPHDSIPSTKDIPSICACVTKKLI